MNPDTIGFAQVMATIVMFSAAMLVLAKVAQLAFWPRKKSTASQIAPGVDEARFSRLEDAVDAIAVEVERIAEAQRFSARLLSERANDRVTEPAPERLPTSRT